ncbi:MAG: TlpA family protein disulfide reductase [Acidobacteriia bacterium]|nr:TlpA family protein disulfide reductase [Terriglobia bacterium]
MPSRPSVAGVLALAALAVFTVWITWRAKAVERGLDHDAKKITVAGKAAPDFSLPTLDGRTVALADFRGKQKVVVTFWASWCGPCRAEMPVLDSLYERGHKPGADFEFVAISIDDDRQAAATFAAQMKMPFPVLLDPAQKTAAAFDVESIPTLFVIDSGGKVVLGKVGFEPSTEMVLSQQLGIPMRMPPGATNAGRGN